MAWYDEAVFYHIYPLGMTGAPKENDYGEPVERLNKLLPWISHIKNIGCNAIYIGPLFESVGHGYETTDYKKLDSRLGTNETLKNFVAECHAKGIKVIFDGVFNHTGRDFFAFKDVKEHRENSRYKDWYCNMNFWSNNSYNDGFSYENWGGYDLLVKLNQRNPEVQNFICDVIRFWVKEFDVDGIRLDAADVLDFEFMKALRRTANEVKPDFWLMGEVIHGDYIRWANADTLHSVTNYHLHKALFSGYNDHNFFEIAHTVKRLYDMGGGNSNGLKLYNFVDNHDVERIISKLNSPNGFTPVHILLYTLPGIPSIYYGSEFAIEGRKGHGAEADTPLRPNLEYEEWSKKTEDNAYLKLVSTLGHMHQQVKALSYGDYQQLSLTNRQYVFSRNYEGTSVIVMVNNDDNSCNMYAPAHGEYVGVLSGRTIHAEGGISVDIAGNSGEIWVPAGMWNPFVEETDVETAESVNEEAAVECETAESVNEEAEIVEGAVVECETAESVDEEAEIVEEAAVECETAESVNEEAEIVEEAAVECETAESVNEEAETVEEAVVDVIECETTQSVDAEVENADVEVAAEEAKDDAVVDITDETECEAAAMEDVVSEENIACEVNAETEAQAVCDVEIGTEEKVEEEVLENPSESANETDTDNETTVNQDESEENTIEVVAESKTENSVFRVEMTTEVKNTIGEKMEEAKSHPLDLNKPYEEMSIEELQAAILAKMRKNGPVTDQMKRDVDVNTHRGSLLTWVRSFWN